MYPLEKYKFYQNGNKVIAVSTYAGKSVRGIANCAESDEFDLEEGKRLAAARCNVKVAERRLKRAEKKFSDAVQYLDEAKQYYKKMEKYLDDAELELNEAGLTLGRIFNDL